MNNTKELLFSLYALSVYRNLQEDPVIQSFMRLLDEECTPVEAAGYYAGLLCALAESGLSLGDYIYTRVLYDDNIFSRLAARGVQIPADLSGALRHNLRVLGEAAYVTSAALKERMLQRFPTLRTAVEALPDYSVGHVKYCVNESDWGKEIDALTCFYAENGYGTQARLNKLLPDGSAADLFSGRDRTLIQELLHKQGYTPTTHRNRDVK